MFLTFCFQKFEGDIERENAESLAADIAEFLNSRKKRSRAGTMPVIVFNAIVYKVHALISFFRHVSNVFLLFRARGRSRNTPMKKHQEMRSK